MLGVIVWDWSLHVRPFGNEVDESLGFDHMVRPVLDGISVELDRPLDDATTSFLIAEDVSERVLHDHNYVEGVEIV
jgi:hypothetical protein